jgi:hypothetical protein
MPSCSHALYSSLVAGFGAAALAFNASEAADDCSGGRLCITKLLPIAKTPAFGDPIHARSYIERVHTRIFREANSGSHE